MNEHRAIHKAITNKDAASPPPGQWSTSPESKSGCAQPSRTEPGPLGPPGAAVLDLSAEMARRLAESPIADRVYQARYWLPAAFLTAAVIACGSGWTAVPATTTVGVASTPRAVARAVTYGGHCR